jgi:hypothetical protein
MNGEVMSGRFTARLAVLLGLIGAVAVITPVTSASATVAPALYRVTAQSPSNLTTPKTITVSCNAGDTLTSVGGRVNDGQGNILLTRAYANAARTVATAFAVEALPAAIAWDVEVFGICAPAGSIGGLSLVQVTSALDPNGKIITATCPAGRVTLGGGYQLNNGNGQVAMDELRFNAAFSSVTATAYAYSAAAGSFTLTTQAVCAIAPPLMSLQTWTTASNALSPKTESTPSCPVNQQTSGVGAVATGLIGAGSISALVPRPQLQAAEATVHEIGPFGGAWNVQVQQICVG